MDAVHVFLYKPAPYLLVASVTTLFDVRRISFPAPGKSFINVHKPTGIKRTSNRNKTEIIGKLAEMSAERGGFKRVYIIIPLPSQNAVSQLVKTMILSSCKLRSITTKPKKDQTCPPAQKKKKESFQLFFVSIYKIHAFVFFSFLLLSF